MDNKVSIEDFDFDFASEMCDILQEKSIEVELKNCK